MSGRVLSSGVLSSGSDAMYPGHGAPKPGAPAACILASAAPKSRAVPGVGSPGGSSSMTSVLSSAPSTAGTGTAPARASQRSPFASAANASALPRRRRPP